MKSFKVSLEFTYEVGEHIANWNIEPQGFDFVETPEQALQLAAAEVEANNIHSFTMNVYDQDGKFLKSN